MLQFRTQTVIYTPLVDWATPESQMTNGARTTIYTEMMEGDVDIDEIPLNAYFIDQTISVDTRSRRLKTTRYGKPVAAAKP